MTEEITYIDIFDSLEYANYNRLMQVDAILNRDYLILKNVIRKGTINSKIGLYIQAFLSERETILNHNNLIKEVINQKCHLKKDWNKKQKIATFYLSMNWEIQSRQQSLDSQNLKPTKEQMKHATYNLKQQMVLLFKNSGGHCTKH